VPKDNEDIMVFGENPIQKLSEARRIQAGQFIQSVLADSSKEAILLEQEFLNDDELDPKLRFQIAESILDRFMGKAAQEVRWTGNQDRPIIFDSRLQRLKAGVEAAVDAITHPTGDSPSDALARAVTAPEDDGGIEM